MCVCVCVCVCVCDSNQSVGLIKRKKFTLKLPKTHYYFQGATFRPQIMFPYNWWCVHDTEKWILIDRFIETTSPRVPFLLFPFAYLATRTEKERKPKSQAQGRWWMAMPPAETGHPDSGLQLGCNTDLSRWHLSIWSPIAFAFSAIINATTCPWNSRFWDEKHLCHISRLGGLSRPHRILRPPI